MRVSGRGAHSSQGRPSQRNSGIESATLVSRFTDGKRQKQLSQASHVFTQPRFSNSSKTTKALKKSKTNSVSHE